MADELIGFPKLKVDDLKRELQKRGLPVKGTKAELQGRLLEYLKKDVSINSEENDSKLGEEIDDNNDIDDSNALDDNNALENSTEEDDINVTVDAELDDDLEVKASEILPTEDHPKQDTSVKELPKAKSEVVEMSKSNTAEERRMARTKRFGQVTNEVDKKKLRAERFKTGGNSTEVNYKGKNVTGEELGKLKKRADRFGVVSPIMGKLDENDRKLKRQERFGLVTSVSTKPLADSLAARRKKRSERFGQA